MSKCRNWETSHQWSGGCVSPLQSSIPCFPPITLCWSDYSALLQPSLVPRHLTHTHTHFKTFILKSPSGPAWRCWCSLSANFEQPGLSAAASWMESLWSDSIAVHWLETSVASPWSLEEFGPDIRGCCWSPWWCSNWVRLLHQLQCSLHTLPRFTS